MNKAKDTKEFVERLDSLKKTNPKDLSSDQDLSVAVMNLISIEEHLAFSGAKTEKTSFYDMIETVREIRKELMHKLIPKYEGEVWCISKHLLAASMRVEEVGTKQLSKNKEEAYRLFDRAYELYCMFWGLNMNLIDSEDVKWVKDTTESIEPIIQKMSTGEEASKKPKCEGFSKIKNFLRKAVNCCIE
ncbi:MAG: hypothetical protein LBS34_01550 [Rickettsiales bacterium]|jgi:hypothetical protein|nr:hypothetical protein [Rickettsiales bacterium]